ADPLMTPEQLIEIAQRTLTQNYKQQPVVLQRGQGCKVWDAGGKVYLDLTGGIAACPLGHAHPKLTRAVAEQAGKLIHVSNLWYSDVQILLADKLTKLAHELGAPR